MRNALDHLSADAVTGVDRRLETIKNEEDASILWAIESGSRAWGFPSPDSDYDARFIYVRSIEQYVSPWPPRDVIEMPIEGDMDVNGWDLGKAIKLVLKGNAVVLEWLQSPIVYQGDQVFQKDMMAFATKCAQRSHYLRHYYHLGLKQWERIVELGDEAPIKKLFYAARPALCLRWMRLDEKRKIPPMNFQKLITEADTPAAMRNKFEDLVAAKAKTREMGHSAIPAEVMAFIENEYSLAESCLPPTPNSISPDETEMAKALFYKYASSLK